MCGGVREEGAADSILPAAAAAPAPASAAANWAILGQRDGERQSIDVVQRVLCDLSLPSQPKAELDVDWQMGLGVQRAAAHEATDHGTGTGDQPAHSPAHRSRRSIQPAVAGTGATVAAAGGGLGPGPGLHQHRGRPAHQRKARAQPLRAHVRKAQLSHEPPPQAKASCFRLARSYAN